MSALDDLLSKTTVETAGDATCITVGRGEHVNAGMDDADRALLFLSGGSHAVTLAVDDDGGPRTVAVQWARIASRAALNRDVYLGRALLAELAPVEDGA